MHTAAWPEREEGERENVVLVLVVVAVVVTAEGLISYLARVYISKQNGGSSSLLCLCVCFVLYISNSFFPSSRGLDGVSCMVRGWICGRVVGVVLCCAGRAAVGGLFVWVGEGMS